MMPWQSQLPTDELIYKTWLRDTKKLSESLRKQFDKWHIQLLSCGDYLLQANEKALLNSTSNHGWQRTILHLDDQLPLIVGRVIVPEITLNCYKKELINLKNGSIGDQLLFIGPGIKRSEFLYNQLSISDLKFKELLKKPFFKNDQTIFARSSIFYLDSIYPLVIEEYFLDVFFELVKVRECD